MFLHWHPGTQKAQSYIKRAFILSGPCAGVLIRNRSQGCCNENIGIENMMLDASTVALGGLRINNTMDTVVGPHMIFLGHREAGLAIHGGHESTVTHCWFGQYYVSHLQHFLRVLIGPIKVPTVL